MKSLFSILIIASPLIAGSQDLNAYIRRAFENNLVLKQKNIALDKSLLALKEAKSLFLPVTTFDAQYLLADGGRSIDIPVGTLLNPVYSTLNQMTGTSSFPSVKNVSEQLNPNNFYDVRVKTVMPILNPDIRINRDIRLQEIKLSEHELAIYKRELVKDIKTSYYNYVSASNAIDIFRSALAVVNENLRINQSLLQNGKGLPAYVSRAESEVSKVEMQLQSAINEQSNARSYFNFLLNEPLTKEISITDANLEILPDTASTTAGREELQLLSTAKDINRSLLKMNKSFRTPRLNAFLDLGSQGFDFTVDRNSLFYLGGLQLKIPIFAGKANLYKIEQSKLDSRSLDIKQNNTQQQLELAASTSLNNLKNAWNVYASLQTQQDASRKYFSLIDRGFREGINSFIEFLDARNQLTTIQLQQNIQKFKVLSAQAAYERETASYQLN